MVSAGATQPSRCGQKPPGQGTFPIDELAQLYASQRVSAWEWLAARTPIETRIRSSETALASMTRSDALADLVGQGEQLRAGWVQLSLTWQHAIVRAVLDHAVIAAGTSVARTLDPNRVTPVWRL